nr:hypothetical protein [Candidatus Njordarchaeum guaymaensis]
MSKQIDVEHLADLKSYLERRLRDLENKVDLYKAYIRAVDSVLTSTSFKLAADLFKGSEAKAEQKITMHEATTETTRTRRIDLTSRDNRMKLGEMTVSGTSVTIIPAQNVRCLVDSGAFNTFFVKNILAGMKDKDEEQVKLRKISDKERINYKITKNDDGTLKDITISNYGDEKRLKRIIQTITWTLEKTVQKPATR